MITTTNEKVLAKKIKVADKAKSDLALREKKYLPLLQARNGDIKQGTSFGLLFNETKSGLRSVNFFQKKVNHLKCEALRANGDLDHGPAETVFEKREKHVFFLAHYAEAANLADGGKRLRAEMLKVEPRGAGWVEAEKVTRMPRNPMPTVKRAAGDDTKPEGISLAMTADKLYALLISRGASEEVALLEAVNFVPAAEFVSRGR